MGSNPVRVTTYAPLAQSVEHVTFNHGVKSPSLLRRTISNYIMKNIEIMLYNIVKDCSLKTYIATVLYKLIKMPG